MTKDTQVYLTYAIMMTMLMLLGPTAITKRIIISVIIVQMANFYIVS